MTEAIIIAVIGSGALSAAVSAFISMIGKLKQSKDGVAHGTQILLCKALKDECRRYIQRGYITFLEHEELTEAYTCYKTELGGNGYAEKLIGLVDKLEKREG